MQPYLHGKHLLLYDGRCKFCNRFVQTIANRDTADKFLFVHLQSETGKKLAEEFSLDLSELSTEYLITNYATPDAKVYEKSKAVFEALLIISPNLIYRLALLLPRFIRDFGYDLVATRRYQLYGQFDKCEIPDIKMRRKYIV